MDDLFKGHLPNGELPDIHLYIFPHLKEFLAVDLREEAPRVTLLNTAEIFDSDFYRSVETEFSHTIREPTEFPFDHLINLPLGVEEIIRGVATATILDRLGIDPEDDEQLPLVMVFVVSGAVLSISSDQLLENFKTLIGTFSAAISNTRWEGVFTRLVKEENTAMKKLNQHELSEAMNGDSLDYFTLWESRN